VNPVLAALLVGAITTFGKWARGKSLDIDTVVGVVVLAVCLAIIDQVNAQLAKAFALLAVVAVTVAHAGVIIDATGLAGKPVTGGGGGGTRDFD
jgi:hypothetical protein